MKISTFFKVAQKENMALSSSSLSTYAKGMEQAASQDKQTEEAKYQSPGPVTYIHRERPIMAWI